MQICYNVEIKKLVEVHALPIRKKNGIVLWPLVMLAAVAVIILTVVFMGSIRWGYARTVPISEEKIRSKLVDTAVSWYGSNEKDDTHRPIIDVYNSHTPLARGYEVQYDDEWCSTFASAVAVQCGFTDLIPTECGCERHIELFAEKGAWVEDDNYLPLPGDYIFYHWGCKTMGDCTHWSDHVGIVVGTWKQWIKVIEGNKDGAVSYRWLRAGDYRIRGYGTPDYSSLAED